MKSRSPKVFISHAREDKDRFVNGFAERLKGKGVYVWVDKDQMLPGDKLIEKIFDEGIDKSDVLIIILSKKSVNKPWVREEAEFGFIKRIEGEMKIIPIKIEECEVPTFLKSTLWETIKDLNFYDVEFNRILSAIFTIHPPDNLGEPPAYTKEPLPQVVGLTNIDVIVLKSIFEYSINESTQIVNKSRIFSKVKEIGITESDLNESLEILSEKGFIQTGPEVGGFGIDIFTLTIFGFQNYAKTFITDFESLLREVLLVIINLDLKTNFEVAENLGIKNGLANLILLLLKRKGFIQVSEVVGGIIHINGVSASAKRLSQSL